ncbi:threonine/serine dehydratase [Acidisphaera sp. L21]|uniref:threonine/serine dehydratase n=1 Tax=Acidisphaera sp. L21 TaxID=1641851 RepID=UPI00131AB17A|nr:threonine/serine dehydratase [Acidisphaera sp. L21]
MTIDRAAINAIRERIRPYVRQTPVMQLAPADFGLACAGLTFKLEFLQHTGSFKVRGAFASLLTREVPAEGVVAASGGNHGAAVAYAAQVLGVPATIFVPSIASAAKLDRIRSYGARLVVGGDSYADALAASEAHLATHGGLAIHAFDAPETLMGQGTLGQEFEEQAPDLDTVLIAVGGGGFIGGVASWYAGRTRVIGVEPELAPTLNRALAAGKPVDAEGGGIAADSLAPRRVGSLMFPIAQAYVEKSVLVPDDAIIAAQRALWERCRVASEPGGAAALAALLSGRYVPQPEERVGVVLCGANIVALP